MGRIAHCLVGSKRVRVLEANCVRGLEKRVVDGDCSAREAARRSKYLGGSECRSHGIWRSIYVVITYMSYAGNGDGVVIETEEPNGKLSEASSSKEAAACARQFLEWSMWRSFRTLLRYLFPSFDLRITARLLTAQGPIL